MEWKISTLGHFFFMSLLSSGLCCWGSAGVVNVNGTNLTLDSLDLTPEQLKKLAEMNEEEYAGGINLIDNPSIEDPKFQGDLDNPALWYDHWHPPKNYSGANFTEWLKDYKKKQKEQQEKFKYLNDPKSPGYNPDHPGFPRPGDPRYPMEGYDPNGRPPGYDPNDPYSPGYGQPPGYDPNDPNSPGYDPFDPYSPQKTDPGWPASWKNLGPPYFDVPPPPWAIDKDGYGKAALCYQPPRKGPCRELQVRWGYNPFKKDCAEFVYGGCRANDNNFMSKKRCREACLGHPTTLCKGGVAADLHFLKAKEVLYLTHWQAPNITKNNTG